MATCASCGTTILFGGTKVGRATFCNAKCAAKAPLLTRAEALPAGDVQREMHQVRNAPCPQCQGPGPVDVHTSHQVYSLLLVTRWRSQSRVSCRACGRKAQATDLAISLVAGWWGFPWGFIWTPIQVGRNIAGLVGRQGEDAPSEALERIVRRVMAADAPTPPPQTSLPSLP